MFCELGDKSPIPASLISFGAIMIAPYAGFVVQQIEGIGVTLRFKFILSEPIFDENQYEQL